MLLTEYNEAEVMELFKEDGRKEGVIIGADKHLIEQICKKLKKGKSMDVIAREVEEELDNIRPICDVAERYAPDYDVEAIYDELHYGKKLQ